MNTYLLHIKAKEDKYIRFILVFEQTDTFLERYIDFDEWKSIERNFLGIREDINKKIRNDLFPKTEFKNLKGEVESFLKKYLFYPGNEKIRLKIIWQANIFLPFEICTNNFHIINFLPLGKQVTRSSNHLVLLYSEDVSHSKEEIFMLSKILNEKFKNFSIEYFCEKDFDSYRSNVLDARFIHLSVHGRVNKNKGEIKLNGKWFENLNHRLSADLVFLNSCEAGCYVNGIVENILSDGATHVIVSPFELYDNIDWQKKTIEFYRHYDITKSVRENFVEFSDKNYLFALFFRLFTSI